MKSFSYIFATLVIVGVAIMAVIVFLKYDNFSFVKKYNVESKSINKKQKYPLEVSSNNVIEYYRINNEYWTYDKSSVEKFGIKVKVFATKTSLTYDSKSPIKSEFNLIFNCSDATYRIVQAYHKYSDGEEFKTSVPRELEVLSVPGIKELAKRLCTNAN